MGTVTGLRTRRYHGLLVVAGDTPAARRLAWPRSTRRVTLPSGARVRLGTHEWASGAVDPRGFELLERFDLVDGLPRWRWRIGDVVLERELAMRARPVRAWRWCTGWSSGGPVRLALDALCTWRDAHGERRADGPAPRVEHGRRRGRGRGRVPAGRPGLGARRRTGGTACTTARRRPAG